jgi:hypothetical protein
VDTSGEMGEMARLLRQAEEEEEGGRETITGVYFRQYLPTSNKVSEEDEEGERGKVSSRYNMIW